LVVDGYHGGYLPFFKNKQMKKLINKILVKRSIRPYKVIALSTGVIVEHYRNGKLKTEYYGLV